MGGYLGAELDEKNQLNLAKIRNAAPERLQESAGPILDWTETGGKWISRYSFSRHRRELRLGSLAEVRLAEARRARDKWASLLFAGTDPISERDRIRTY